MQKKLWNVAQKFPSEREDLLRFDFWEVSVQSQISLDCQVALHPGLAEMNASGFIGRGIKCYLLAGFYEFILVKNFTSSELAQTT